MQRFGEKKNDKKYLKKANKRRNTKNRNRINKI